MENPVSAKDESAKERPTAGERQVSRSMIVPYDHPEIELKDEVYAPGDARTLSPCRDSAEIQRMVGSKRSNLQSAAVELSSGLKDIIGHIESVKEHNDKLARNNKALSDYIGGLTQSMSKTNLGGAAGSKSGGKKR